MRDDRVQKLQDMALGFGDQECVREYPQFLIDSQTLCNEDFTDRTKQKEENYYNIEKTDNPYIIKYSKVDIENLSNNFKIMTGHIYNQGLAVINNNKTMFSVIDADVLTVALSSYKEQLLKDKKKTIIDRDILFYDNKNILYFNQVYLHNLGLTINDEGRISLKRVYKAKDPKVHVVSKGEINTYIKYCLENYMSTKLGISIKISVTTKNRYTVITKFKKMFSDIPLSTLSVGINSFWGNNGIQEACEELWNNPKLAKPEPKKKATKKETKK